MNELLANDEKVRKIHEESLYIDGLTDAAWNAEYFQKMLDVGFHAVNVTVATPYFVGNHFYQAMEEIHMWYNLLDKHKDQICLVKTANDILEAKKQHRIGIIFGFQSGSPIGNDLRMLRIFYELGLRILTPTYNERNLLADGCTEPTNAGLSTFGRQVVTEMSRLGVVLDLSHPSEQTCIDAIELSKDPVVFTHSNSSTLCDNPRNAKDHVLQAMAEKEGVVCMSVFPAVLTRKNIKPERTLEDFFKHLEYCVDLVGVDHVGIGLDIYRFDVNDAYERGNATEFLRRLKEFPEVFDEVDKDPVTFENIYPKDIEGIHKIPNITRGLLDRGFSRQDIEKIRGLNLLRVFQKVWK
jgi:membrane dipeptidase